MECKWARTNPNGGPNICGYPENRDHNKTAGELQSVIASCDKEELGIVETYAKVREFAAVHGYATLPDWDTFLKQTKLASAQGLISVPFALNRMVFGYLDA